MSEWKKIEATRGGWCSLCFRQVLKLDPVYIKSGQGRPVVLHVDCQSVKDRMLKGDQPSSKKRREVLEVKNDNLYCSFCRKAIVDKYVKERRKSYHPNCLTRLHRVTRPQRR